MNKEDLKYGNVVELRNGRRYLYHRSELKLMSLDGNYFLSFHKYDENLNNEGDKDFDIIKVYENYTLRKLLWERKPKLTGAEKVILRNLDESYIWIGRDDGGYLSLSGYETVECEFHCYSHLFKFIENGKDYIIKDLLKE